MGICAAPAAQALATAATARDVTVDTDLYKAVFSSRGGSLKKLVLKKYREKEGPHGTEVGLIAEEAPENYTLKTEGKGFAVDPEATCSVNSDSFTVGKGDTRELEFTCSSPQGDTLKKSYTIHGNSYGIELKQQVVNTSAARQEGVLRLVLNTRVGDTQKESRFEEHGPVTLAGKDVAALKMKDLEKGPKQYDKEVHWTGLRRQVLPFSRHGRSCLHRLGQYQGWQRSCGKYYLFPGHCA